MRYWTIPLLLAAAGFAPALPAQEPHFGFGINLAFPTGDFRSSSFPSAVQPGVRQTDRYDVGFGGQFTISFPVDPKVAVRMNIGGQTTEGTNTEPGYSDRINLEHQLFSLGGELQVFPGAGSAYRHQGTYLLGGVSADFERFDRSYGTPNWDDTASTRKSRLGGTLGIGHSFGYGGFGRFTLEGSYHKTLSGHDVAAGDPPATDFARASFGWVF
jgi:hypothetical protein